MMIKAYHVLNPLALFISLRQTLQSELVKTTVVGFSNLKIGSLISNFNFCSPAHFKRAKAYRLWYRMFASLRCSDNRSLSHKSPGILPNFDHFQVHFYSKDSDYLFLLFLLQANAFWLNLRGLLQKLFNLSLHSLNNFLYFYSKDPKFTSFSFILSTRWTWSALMSSYWEVIEDLS